MTHTPIGDDPGLSWTTGQPDIAEPAHPGGSMTYLGGRPLRRYLTWYGFASFSLVLTFGSVVGILLPNHVQALEFARWFTGPDAAVDLAELSHLKDAVAGGATATAEEQRLLGLLGQFDAGRAEALSLVSALGLVGTMLAVPVIGILSDRTRSRHGRRTCRASKPSCMV
ncbi:hypothetical protein [Nonomuraea sp. GTA35]|uniref:hypothetical protein n=1 Tax=Nonomuraea sp. GTA35 TaxID=1676746 RepID=UPI0035BF428C